MNPFTGPIIVEDEALRRDDGTTISEDILLHADTPEVAYIVEATNRYGTLSAAVAKLIKAKGRYHSELAYQELVQLHKMTP